jgi:BMFP domain-containing protein YqiC
MSEEPQKATEGSPGSDEQAGGSESGGRPVSDSLREAVEGAFAATGITMDKAQDLGDRTRDRAQDLVGEVSRLGRDARDALEGMRLVSRDELAELSRRIEGLEARLDAFESGSGSNREE